jgi:hypothetical protein
MVHLKLEETVQRLAEKIVQAVTLGMRPVRIWNVTTIFPTEAFGRLLETLQANARKIP